MILYTDSINLYIPHAGLLHNFQGTVQNKNVGPFIHKLEGLSCDNLPLTLLQRVVLFAITLPQTWHCHRMDSDPCGIQVQALLPPEAEGHNSGERRDSRELAKLWKVGVGVTLVHA